MKKYINPIKAIFCILLFSACSKYGNYEIGNNISTVYFAYQKPVRTLIADSGKVTFELGVTLGGVRSNTKDIQVNFKIDSSLLSNSSIMGNSNYKLLPPGYYTLDNASQIIIPKGSYDGTVSVTLNQKFLDDSASYTDTYVLPVSIVSTTADSILSGSEENGIAAKNYTVIVIKYINKYDATYYHRGIRYGFDANNNPIDTFQYVKPEDESEYMVNYVWNLTTNGENKLLTNGVEYYSTATNKNYSMQLTVDDDQKVHIDNVAASLIHNIVDDGGSKYDSANKKFYLNYHYLDAASGNTYRMKDTLIFRNLNLSLETW